MSRLTIKVKLPTPIADDVAATTLVLSTGTKSTAHQPPAAGTQPTQEPPAASHASHEVRHRFHCDIQLTHSLQDARADAASLKLLQVSELQAWVSDNKVVIPKLKRKDGM